MQIERNGPVLIAEKELNIKHEADYILKLINIYSATSVGRSFWLTEREKQFYVTLVILNNMGIVNFKEKEADSVFKYYFGEHKKGARADYVGKLKDKGWLQEEKSEIKLLPLFQDMDLESDEFELNLKYTIEKEEDVN